jgi:capsular polysaccharide biosynthesis protein
MEKEYGEEIEINLKDIWYLLLDKLWIIVFATIICALFAVIGTKLLLQPKYESTTKLYVINRQDTSKVTSADLATGSQLTKDFQILVKSRPVTEQVIAELNLDLSHEQLVSCIAVNTPEDSRVLEITVTYTDPYTAKKLADTLGNVSALKMVSILEMEKANIIEPGNVPYSSVSPNVAGNGIIGGLLGGLLVAIIFLIRYFMNDSIKSSEDIEKHLGLTILGSIPLDDDLMGSKKVRAELRKAYKKGYKGGVENAIY